MAITLRMSTCLKCLLTFERGRRHTCSPADLQRADAMRAERDAREAAEQKTEAERIAAEQAEHDARVREEGRRAGLEEAAQIALAEQMPESFGVLTDATDAAADTMAKAIANAIRVLAAKGGAK
jgi:flagellar biosynthesis/type III secretory pathway protein FliH